MSTTTINRVYNKLLNNRKLFEIILSPDSISPSQYYKDIIDTTLIYLEMNDYKKSVTYFIQESMKHPKINDNKNFKIVYNAVFKAFKNKEYKKIERLIQTKIEF